jgi:hypothetical protein
MRFHGKVGFGETVETSPGVYEDTIVEHEYFGDVTRAARRLAEGEDLNPDLSLTNTISIVANAYASEHFTEVRYVEWCDEFWTVTDVEVQPPRLLFRLGEVYNGPKGGTPVGP